MYEYSISIFYYIYLILFNTQLFGVFDLTLKILLSDT